MRVFPSVVSAWLLAGCFSAGLAQVAPPAPAKPAYEADAKFVAALDAAKLNLHQHDYAAAIDEYKKANKVANGACVNCLVGLYDAQMKVGKFKDAVATATTMQPLVSSSIDKSLVASDLGRALMAQAGSKPKPEQLEAAHTAFAASLAAYPKNGTALFSDGCVLARMGKNDEASKEFQACADGARPHDPVRTRAEHFAENPALSMNQMAPPFEVKTSDGTRFNLDNMSGHVVLIDFWATWCGPCNEELPHLQRLVKQFANEPLTVISISWDRDEEAWKSFIAKHEMTWVQYRDADHSLSNSFGVPSIPHYFLVDSDGLLYPQMLGADDDVSGKIKKLLARAKAKSAATQVASAGNE